MILWKYEVLYFYKRLKLQIELTKIETVEVALNAAALTWEWDPSSTRHEDTRDRILLKSSSYPFPLIHY
jgi:hypothetical protein